MKYQFLFSQKNNFEKIRMWSPSTLLIYSTLRVMFLFVCVEVLRPSQPNGVMSSAVSLPNHTFTGQA